jgi:thiol-disulfide isomerase/thioredoxin
MVDILYFSAEWCGPCKMIKPQFLQYCAENTGSVNPTMYNVDTDTEVTAQYDVRNVPTFIIVKDGEEVRRIIGGLPMFKFKEIVAQYEN